MRNPLRTWTETFEAFILQVMQNERRDRLRRFARFLLRPLSKLFRLGVRLRRFLHGR